jgi:DNA repair exonuclease SbcCD nuclease subunit
MSIYLWGDLHADPIRIENLVQFAKELTRDDYIIILGDFGLIFNQQFNWTELDLLVNVMKVNKEQITLEKLANLPPYIFMIDGNHENFDRLEKLKIVNAYGGQASLIQQDIFGNKKILWLRRGEIYHLNNRKILTFGGATSPDKNERQKLAPYQLWWPQEVPSYSDQENFMKNGKSNKFEVDYILSHTCPQRIKEQIVKNNTIDDPTERILNIVESKMKFKHWYFGHFHIDQTIEDKFTVVYDKVVSL